MNNDLFNITELAATRGVGPIRRVAADDPISTFIVGLNGACPYTGVASARGDIWCTPVALGAKTGARSLFYTGIICTEILRQARRFPHGGLVCINIAYGTERTEDPEGGLGVAHYLLKCLYTKVGVMFGKFWSGERLSLRNGHQMPDPQINFLSIRTSVPRSDEKFFNQARTLRGVLSHANDDGGAVSRHYLPGATYSQLISGDVYTEVKRDMRTRIQADSQPARS